MRLSLIFVIVLALLNGCGQRNTQTESTTTDTLATSGTTQADTLCFRQITGRDSTTLQLYVDGTDVTGELNVLPFERPGAWRCSGTLANNQIVANWQRAGEGVTQSYEVVFTLKGDAVSWREGERIEKQGKWVLKNPDQGYEYVLTKAACW